ncbi:Hypothetical predicted protein [Pelobates cultripes]|uniref:Uncharacterized protein n=1 Tax=Pelobates cultripes TaxID=61616 RepID=A0AAD1W3Z3_PELCU|nr:Hypothetical predicted protein [Pelobates cultripes]
MQSPADKQAIGPSTTAKPSKHNITALPTGTAAIGGGEEESQDHTNSEDFQALLDATMNKSATQAIFNAMGVMSDTLSHTISSAIMASGRNPGSAPPITSDTKPMVPSGRKATGKSHHLTGVTSKISVTDRLRPVENEDVVLPSKRSLHREKAVRIWKRAKALPDSSDSDSDSEEVSNRSDASDPVDSDNSSPERSEPAPPAIDADQEADESAILDPQREPLFDPDTLQKTTLGGMLSHNSCGHLYSDQGEKTP